ncbi:MAG: maleylacetoacetate isomerase [Proteobacteria bacterium]|nr:maleylacetoacetate isomerase [Pseudomonadota bacterium]
MLKLYTYFRSSASYRVRIALNLKGLAWEAVPVHLVKDGGQQHAADFAALNPNRLVPVLRDGDAALVQSMAIIEYLEECHPQPPLLPADPLGRARVRALAQTIACEIHPLNNLRVLRYLEQQLEIDAEGRSAWYRHWVETGFAALERMLADSPDTGRFCHGDLPTLADCCLVPQVFNAERFKVPLAPYPTIQRIAEHCQLLEPFRSAAPEAQPDAE